MLTGGAGTIGSTIVDQLLIATTTEVIALDLKLAAMNGGSR
jgi:nucleoside-diphosphate-sugar epimerase